MDWLWEQGAGEGRFGGPRVGNMGLVLKAGLSYLCAYPKPDWCALGCNEVPITGGNQGEPLNCAQEAGGGGCGVEKWSWKIPKHLSFGF